MNESTLGLIYSEYIFVLVILSLILTQSPFTIFLRCTRSLSPKWILNEGSIVPINKAAVVLKTIGTLLYSSKLALPSLYILHDNSSQVSENWIYKFTWNFPLMHLKDMKSAVFGIPALFCVLKATNIRHI
jgi:hypothetical protein